MYKYQHRLLTDIDESGFGVRFEDNLADYIPPHWHKAVELLLFVQGQVTCNLGSASLHAKPGDICIINSHDVHSTRCSRHAVFLVIHIDPQVMCRYLPTFDQLQFSLAFDPEDQERAEAFEQLQGHLQEIRRQTEENNPESKLERQSRLFALTALLVRYFSKPLARENATLRRSDMTRLEPVLDYIQLNHARELPLDEAANFMGLNREYFCRLFKRNMGISYLQYVYQVRTTAFCRDLENTDEPIGELAERHGFREPKMLNQYFKEIYGCTPSEKRKHLREITDPEEE